MLDFVNTIKYRSNSVYELNDCIRQGVPSAVFGVNKAFKNYLVSTIDSPVLFVVKDAISAEQNANEIKEFSNKNVVYIPPKDFNLVMLKAFSKEGLFARLNAIDKIDRADVIVVTPETLMQGFPKKLKNLTLLKGEERDLLEATSHLLALGYERVEQCLYKGTFSVFGDVLDVFPVNAETPIRIDFFGDEIESIKSFDAESRQTLKTLPIISVLQCSEFLLEDENLTEITKFLDKEIGEASKEKATRLRGVKEEILRA